MYGDFSRLSFAPQKHFSAVLTQQGRVSLDADANENTFILLHYMRTLAADLIGPFAGPAGGHFGFEISPRPDGTNLSDLDIHAGRYYVDGLLVENDASAPPWTYTSQPYAPRDSAGTLVPLPAAPFLVYLKVWELPVNFLQDPDIREIALGSNGPDTALRTKVVWQVLAIDQTPGTTPPTPIRGSFDNENDFRSYLDTLVEALQPAQRGRLRAQARQDADTSGDICIASPDARYRGPENQLYRVEVHTGGKASTAGTGADVATFKWSRENGSVSFAIDALEGDSVILASLGRDSRLGLEIGDWVEIVDDAYAVRPDRDPLRQVMDIEPIDRRVTLDAAPTSATGHDPRLHPVLRRWDQTAGNEAVGGLTLNTDPSGDNAALIREPSDGHDRWLTLEDGVQIQFQADGAIYRSGDYWLIPARTEIGDVLWPGVPDNPLPRPPDGIEYHFALLSLVTDTTILHDLRRRFQVALEPPTPFLP